MENKNKIVVFLIFLLIAVFIFGIYDPGTIKNMNIKFNFPNTNNSELKTENGEGTENKVDEITYPEDAYVNGILDPQKLKSTAALNQDTDLVLVNKQYILGEDYAPEVEEVEGSFLQPHVIDAYKEMKDDAAKDGVSLMIGSAYRSYSEQSIIFNSYLENDPYETVITYSAYPGTSEHQTGLVIDFVELGTCDYTECFEETDSGKWLKENAYKYGFILRYKKEKEDITGYMYEPWHYRYVGKDTAKEIHDKNITLEEYVLLK